MVTKLKHRIVKLSEDRALIERINTLCLQTFPGAPELATLYAGAMRGQIDSLKPRALDANDAFNRLAKTLEKVVRTHAATLRDFMVDEAVTGPTSAALLNTNQFRPTVDEVNQAAGMVARNLESRALGDGEKVIDALKGA